ncbi:MAG: GNAT family N-acetyltransferase [Nocardioides sp.]
MSRSSPPDDTSVGDYRAWADLRAAHRRVPQEPRVARRAGAPHRGHGFATLLVRDVVAWARSVQADRVDLSATSEGQRHYARLGFQVARAPRMKLVL